jgi:hypothetical protein
MCATGCFMHAYVPYVILVSCNLSLLCCIYNLGLYLIVWRSMLCLLNVCCWQGQLTSLTSLAHRSDRCCICRKSGRQTSFRNRSDRYCVTSCPFSFSCVLFLYDTFTLVSTPQIERYKGNSMIHIEYVQMACLGHFWNFSGNAHFQGELLIYLWI